MTFDEWIEAEHAAGNHHTEYASAMMGWEAGQDAERERVKSRVREAAESLWCIKNQGDAPYELYLGPSMNTLEKFVEKLLEEE